MKKFFSGLFTLLILAAIGGSVYLFPEFYHTQFDKIRGMYYVHKGDKAYKKWKLQKAIDYYLRAVKLYPAHYTAWYNLGNIYVAYEDYYSAVDAYEQAIRFNPKFMVARMNYGIISTEKLGDFDGAIDQYNAIINVKRRLLSIPFIFNNRRSTKTNRGLAYYNMGVAYKQKSVYSGDEWDIKRIYLLKALYAYENAVKILKKDYDARYNLALTYHLLGNYHEAGMNYCKAIELSPMQYEAHYNLAILLRHLKYYKESLDELEKATSLITNSDGATNRQMYVFDVMNDVTRTILAGTDSKTLVEELNEITPKDESGSVTYVHGKLVATEELDNAIIKNFSTCASAKIFEEDIEEGITDVSDFERDTVRIPPVDEFSEVTP